MEFCEDIHCSVCCVVALSKWQAPAFVVGLRIGDRGDNGDGAIQMGDKGATETGDGGHPGGVNGTKSGDSARVIAEGGLSSSDGKRWDLTCANHPA